VLLRCSVDVASVNVSTLQTCRFTLLIYRACSVAAGTICGQRCTSRPIPYRLFCTRIDRRRFVSLALPVTFIFITCCRHCASVELLSYLCYDRTFRNFYVDVDISTQLRSVYISVQCSN